jgi:elongation of very long chain fatty acids protein 7
MPAIIIIAACAMFQFQFCLVFLHSLLILRKECNYPKFVVGLLSPNAMFFYFLFNDFYQSAYKKRAPKAVEGSDNEKLAETTKSD